MTIDCPTETQIPQLRSLWKKAFGDTDAFLDIFFHRAYAPERSRCITRSGDVVAALYWFDCTWFDKKLAYFYAVATDPDSRGQGLCRKLMEDTHRHLASLGYDGCILVPQEDGLYTMYSKFGYQVCSHIRQFSCTAGGEPVALTQATPREYAAARRALLSENSVLQEGITLDFLNTYAHLYTGKSIALAAYPNEGKLTVCELLGDPQSAPGILTALGFHEGSFCTPGYQQPLAMYHTLTEDTAMPGYFGLALN